MAFRDHHVHEIVCLNSHISSGTLPVLRINRRKPSTSLTNIDNNLSMCCLLFLSSSATPERSPQVKDKILWMIQDENDVKMIDSNHISGGKLVSNIIFLSRDDGHCPLSRYVMSWFRPGGRCIAQLPLLSLNRSYLLYKSRGPRRKQFWFGVNHLFPAFIRLNHVISMIWNNNLTAWKDPFTPLQTTGPKPVTTRGRTNRLSILHE